jgi:hypothetical protein
MRVTLGSAMRPHLSRVEATPPQDRPRVIIIMLTIAIVKKSAATAITAVALSAVVIAGTATAAEAGKKRHHHGGAAAAAGIAAFATGLAIGAGRGPIYGGPVYGAPVYGPDCYIEKTRRYNRRGQLVIIKREVCY